MVEVESQRRVAAKSFELEKKLLRVIKSLASEEEKRMKRDFQQDARSLKKSEWL